MSASALVILGCGFTGIEAARQARASGVRVVGTTRDGAKLAQLASVGVEAHVAPTLTGDAVRALLPDDAAVLVTFAPDGATDRAVAPALAGRRVVYLSTTGVFGGARGRVDEETPVDRGEPRAALRLDAEAAYRHGGAVVLRAAGIYGPWRGLHRRLLDGTFRVPGTGANVVSRIHVSDLAAIALRALEETDVAGETFVIADDQPVAQIEVIDWLVQLLGVARPSAAPLEEVPTTLRHDRAVDNARVKRRLGIALRHPGYREGFVACLAAERGSRAQ
jgi:nucleoside-diphosphate-sugar epimerase